MRNKIQKKDSTFKSKHKGNQLYKKLDNILLLFSKNVSNHCTDRQTLTKKIVKYNKNSYPKFIRCD